MKPKAELREQAWKGAYLLLVDGKTVAYMQSEYDRFEGRAWYVKDGGIEPYRTLLRTFEHPSAYKSRKSSAFAHLRAFMRHLIAEGVCE